MCSIMGLTDFNPDSFSAKMEEMLAIIRQVNEQFRDPVSIGTVRYQLNVLWFLVFMLPIQYCQFLSAFAEL